MSLSRLLGCEPDAEVHLADAEVEMHQARGTTNT